MCRKLLSQCKNIPRRFSFPRVNLLYNRFGQVQIVIEKEGAKFSMSHGDLIPDHIGRFLYRSQSSIKCHVRPISLSLLFGTYGGGIVHLIEASTAERISLAFWKKLVPRFRYNNHSLLTVARLGWLKIFLSSNFSNFSNFPCDDITEKVNIWHFLSTFLLSDLLSSSELLCDLLTEFRLVIISKIYLLWNAEL